MPFTSCSNNILLSWTSSRRHGKKLNEAMTKTSPTAGKLSAHFTDTAGSSEAVVKSLSASTKAMKDLLSATQKSNASMSALMESSTGVAKGGPRRRSRSRRDQQGTEILRPGWTDRRIRRCHSGGPRRPCLAFGRRYQQHGASGVRGDRARCSTLRP